MTQENPITPPPELVKQWWKEAQQADYSDGLPCWLHYVATQAARWGADQELEACVKLLSDLGGDGEMIRRVRRPKPPSLKELALQALYRFDDTEGHEGLTPKQIADDFVLIRRALESLPS